MRAKTLHALEPNQPSEHEIRGYAYRLFENGSREPGHDLEHWFEATAQLSANVARHRNGVHRNPPIHDPAPSELSLDS
jgi:hypothetical protein